MVYCLFIFELFVIPIFATAVKYNISQKDKISIMDISEYKSLVSYISLFPILINEL